MKSSKAAVDEAKKEVGAILENLENSTGGEVKNIGLDAVVDTDPLTGSPVIKKTVDIKLSERPAKTWVR